MPKRTAAKPAKPTLPAVGRTSPDFTLPDQAGEVHRLKDYRGQWVILYFYPKDDTPGCSEEACQFRDAARRITHRNAVVIGVSPDSSASHEKFADKLGLPFTLLADEGEKICKKYGVWQQKTLYGRRFMGVVRTTFLIDPDGKVAHRWDRVRVPGHADDVLATLDRNKAR